MSLASERRATAIASDDVPRPLYWPSPSRKGVGTFAPNKSRPAQPHIVARNAMPTKHHQTPRDDDEHFSKMKNLIVASRTFLSNIALFWTRHIKAVHERQKGLREKPYRPMAEHCRFWVVAVPTVGGSVARTLATLASATSALGLSVNNELRVPRLQVGTLDTLMGLSDTIAKVDEQAEATVKKIAKQYLDTIEERSEKKLSQRAETALFVDNDSPAAFVRKFSWDRARYPLSAPLGSLIETIGSGCVKYGEDLRMLSFKYNETKTNLTTLNRKESGSLLVRPLSLIVGPKDMIEGEYLESTIVVVALSRENEWLSTYEKIEDDYVPPDNVKEANPFSRHSVKCRAVVPGSSLELFRDHEYIAYRVILIKKYGHRFKEPAKVKRFICREYHYDEAEVANSAAAKLQLQKEMDYLWRNLVKWCATAYSEVFKAWIHIKVIRVFIESVLRFGLPIDFAVATLEVKPDKEEPLRSALLRLYSNLSGASMTQTTDEIDYSGVGADFYPYVFLKVDV